MTLEINRRKAKNLQVNVEITYFWTTNGSKGNQKEKKISWNDKNGKTMYQTNGMQQSSPERKAILTIAYIKKLERPQVNNLTLHFLGTTERTN